MRMILTTLAPNLRLVLCVWLLSSWLSVSCVNGWVERTYPMRSRKLPTYPVRLFSQSASSTTEPGPRLNSDLTPQQQLCQKIEECLQQDQDPRPWLRELDTVVENDLDDDAPNRRHDVLCDDTWHVWYTDCPPPSNGQLGPLTGSAEQVIARPSTTSPLPAYQNILKVPPHKDWLVATLDGVWEEWDGELLKKTLATTSKSNEIASLPDTTSQPKDFDWGARYWKVTFVQIQLALFGFPLFSKTFPPDTCRVWRTSYIGPNHENKLVRVVWAGQTGRREDEYAFYTARQEPPTTT